VAVSSVVVVMIVSPSAAAAAFMTSITLVRCKGKADSTDFGRNVSGGKRAEESPGRQCR
jgi:hypothetical protein